MIFRSKLVALDVSSESIQAVRGTFKFSKIFIDRWKVILRRDEDVKNLARDLNVDVEDVLATNMPMDLIIFQTFEIVPGMKRDEVVNYGKMMASRNLGLSPEEVSVDLVGSFGNKGIFAISKMENVRKTVDNVASLGFPEPDIVVPDAFKFVYITSIPVSGEMLIVALNFLQDYITLIVFSDGEIVAVRTIGVGMGKVFDLVEDHFGISREELILKTSFDEDDKELVDFLKTSFSDIPMELNREIRATLGEAIKEIDTSDIDVVRIHSDPTAFEDILVEVFKESGSFPDVPQIPMEKVSIQTSVSRRIKGALGLLVRCGYEFGKVKSVQIKG